MELRFRCIGCGGEIVRKASRYGVRCPELCKDCGAELRRISSRPVRPAADKDATASRRRKTLTITIRSVPRCPRCKGTGKTSYGACDCPAGR